MRPVVLLLLGIHLVYARTHSLKYLYTAVTGVTDFPEFTVVGLVDDQPFFYFNSDTKEAVPRAEWIKQNMEQDYWRIQTEIDRNAYESFKHNLIVLKSRFNMTTDVHTYQEMYGCTINAETGATSGFKEYGYNGEDFLSLDLTEMIWISPVQQGLITTQRWNEQKAYLESDKAYLSFQCIDWLKKYVMYGGSSLEKTVSPQVSLLQKSSSSPVVCHATGFYPSAIKISWQKNGQDHDEDVELGELLPNADGTFQKTSTLNVTLEEWEKDKFTCDVEHQGRIRREGGGGSYWSSPIYDLTDSISIGFIAGVVADLLLLAFGVGGYMVYRKKQCYKPASASDDGSNSSAHTVPQA